MKFLTACTAVLLLAVPTFSQITYSDKQHLAKGYPVTSTDLDGDGVGDLIAIGTETLSLTSRWGFYVSLSFGDGTFDVAKFYGPPAPSASSSIATGDFDRDAHADVAFVNGSNQLHIFLNNGNGTFAAPITKTMTHTLREVAAADFNRDSKLDLVFISTGNVVRSLGNGDGTFQSTQSVGNTANGADYIMTGDFDNDTRADFATSWAHCSSGTGCDTNLYVFHGLGTGAFEPAALIHYDEDFYFYRAFDLDDNGSSEIVGTGAIGSESFIRVIRDFTLGAPSDHFIHQDIPLAKGVHTDRSSLAEAADLNGDSTEDLVVIVGDGTTNYVALKPKLTCCFTDTYGPEEYLFDADDIRAVVMDRFNTGTRPDLVAKTGTIFAGGTNHFLINSTDAPNFPDCDVPRAASGMRTCTPQSGGTHPYGTNFHVGTIFTSPLRLVELWMDGRRTSIAFNAYGNQAFMDINEPFLFNGPHVASFYAHTFDGRKLNKKVSFNIVDPLACPMPSGTGINICDPGSTEGQTTPVNVTGRTANKTVRMEMWINARKISSFGGNNLRFAVGLQPGSYLFSFYAIDSNGSKVNATRRVVVN
jgi:hypothetical protein